MATSEQLEREAEAARAHIASTLDELRSRMSPGQMVDQLIDYTRDSGGGEFFRNFGRQIVDNPIPVTLVGAGLAWLMAAGRRASAARDGGDLGLERAGATVRDKAVAASEGLRDAARRDQTSATVADLSEHAARRAHDWARQTRSTAARLGERADEAAASLQETAGATGAAAAAAYEAASERSRQGADAIARNAKSVSQNAAASGRNALAFLQEQPLVLAGLGLALGAVLGASLPPTEAENRLMGDASAGAKRDAKAFADEQVDKGKAVAEQAWNAAKPEIKPEMEEQRHRQADDSRAASGSEAGAGHEPGREATLVPLDEHEAAQAETARDDARRGTTEHSG
jgi:hypothetical protein